MVTQQVEQLARQSYFDAVAELFVAPDHADTYDRLQDALHAVAGLAAEVGVDCRELEAALEEPLPPPEEAAAEFGALFATGEIPLPLYESAWTEDASAPEVCRAAYEKARAEGLSFTDESGVYAQYIAPPHLFTGERENRKLTYAEDFLPAERVGFGVDTHAFGAERDFVTLAGVRIPHESGLIAHSDGDVVCHALMDALLSAAGLDDIGHRFPDTDERFKNADSMELLRKVVVLLANAGYAAKNASISVLAEKPRLSPHIAQMKENLAGALGVHKNAVGIAAGTNERLGYVGEGKGITVYATVLLMPVKG